jgi:hypothetical protein
VLSPPPEAPVGWVCACLKLWVGGGPPHCTGERDPRLGILFLLLSCCVQGAQYVFEEKVMAIDGLDPMVLVGMEVRRPVADPTLADRPVAMTRRVPVAVCRIPGLLGHRSDALRGVSVGLLFAGGERMDLALVHAWLIFFG